MFIKNEKHSKIKFSIISPECWSSSCTEANAKHHHDEATKCIGSKPCSVGHVKIVITANTVTAGGKCGVCSRN